MSYSRLFIHVVWSTKNRQPFLEKEYRCKINDHIYKYAKENNIIINVINSHLDHVHCMLLLRRDQNLSQIEVKVETPFSYVAAGNQALLSDIMAVLTS